MRITSGIENNVLWLNISVKNVPRMNKLKSRSYTGNKKCHVSFFEYQSLPKIVAQIPSPLQVQNNIARSPV